jgi:hypothetical protein
LIREEQLGLLKNLVLKVLEQRFRYNVTGAWATMWKWAMVVQNREAAALGEDTAQACREGKEAGKRCDATQGWCSPFIGTGGAPVRKCRWVTAGDLRPTPLMAGEGVNGASRGRIEAGE